MARRRVVICFFFTQWSWGETGYAWMEVWILSLFFMISKVGVVLGCNILLMFFCVQFVWGAKEMKLKHAYYYFG